MTKKSCIVSYRFLCEATNSISYRFLNEATGFIIRNQAKQARPQSLYRCDKIIYMPAYLLNVKGYAEVALKRWDGSALIQSTQ